MIIAAIAAVFGLTGGELDKIIEINAAYSFGYENNEKKYYPSSRGDYQNNPNYKHKKRRGFLEDLFDFD